MSDQAGQPLRASATGDHAKVDVVVGNLSVVADDHDVGGLHQLEAAGHCDTLDCGDHRDFDGRNGITRLTERVEQRSQRFGASGSEAFDLGHIASGAEVFTGSTNDDHFHRRLSGQFAQRILELAREFGGDRVQTLGAVQRDAPDSVGVRVLDDAHRWSHPSFRKFLI